MERGEDEAIDSSNNQDLAGEGGHLGGERGGSYYTRTVGRGQIVCSYTYSGGTATAVDT